MNKDFLEVTKIKQNNIFFDCFNTIICRKISTKNVIFNFCKKLGIFYSIEPAVLYKIYIKTTQKNAITNKLKTGESEVFFEEILKTMANYLTRYLTKLDVQKFVLDAIKFYIEAEKESQYLNEGILDFLTFYKNCGKKIYIVSDFYCGKEIIKEFLNKLNILNFFEDIFVSCDIKLSKRTGKLYKKVLNILNINPKDVIMIGDNFHSDYVKAKQNGIKAIRISTKINRTNNNLKPLVKNGANFKEFEEIFNLFGDEYNFSNYAFPLFVFTKRLFNEIEKSKTKNLFFFAREGQFLKKLFDTYCELTGQGQHIKTHYLLVSRNSVFVASLQPLEIENFSSLINETLTMSLKKFLTSLNFNKEEIYKVNSELKEDLNKKYFNFNKLSVFKNLLKNKDFIDLYNKKRTQQRIAFDFYLKSFGIDFEKDGMSVVDVGWKGTIQNLVCKFFDNKVKIKGYYVGCKQPLYSNQTKKGLLFNKGKDKFFGNSIFHHKMYDYEQVCRANHNRVDGYEIENQSLKIIYDQLVDDNKHHKEIVNLVQNQVYEKFTKICTLDYKYCSYIEVTAIKYFWKMIKNISKKDSNWLVSCEKTHYDNFARIGFTFTIVSNGILKFVSIIRNFEFLIRNYLKVKTLKIRY